MEIVKTADGGNVNQIDFGDFLHVDLTNKHLYELSQIRSVITVRLIPSQTFLTENVKFTSGCYHS